MLCALQRRCITDINKIVKKTGKEMYNKEEIEKIVDAQREFFLRGETLDVNWRIQQLKKGCY